MPRRLLIFLALTASLAVVACSSTPQASPLTDPKEILAKSVESLASVKTATIKGTFSGSFSAPEMGPIDLSTVTLDAAVDIPGKKLRVALDAPSILGTNVELISVDEVSYLKILGPMGAMIGADASGKFLQLPASGGIIPEDATDPTQAIAEVRKALDALPTPPEKLADERCGDQDCYRVKIPLTAAELGDVAAGATGSVDIWVRKNDLRPARLGLSVDGGAQGTVAATFELTYDQGVNITAPPADQITPAG